MTGSIEEIPLPDLLLDKISKILGVNRPNSQITLSKLQDNAVSPPQIPDPSTTQAHVNAPADKYCCSPCFDVDDVLVLNTSMEQGDWAKGN